MARFLTAVLFASLVVFAAGAKIKEEDDVLVLTDDNFDDAIAEYDNLLVEFYAPWCGHCKKLAPEYAKAAKALKKDGLAIAKLDATAHPDAAAKFEVQGYPTLKFFRGGSPTEYGGGRTESDIVQWVRKKSGPAARTLSSTDDADEFAEEGDVKVIGIFDDVESADAKQYLRAAAANDDVSFAITSDADVAAKYDVKAPAIVLLKNFDEGRNDFDGSFTDLEITEFVAGNQLPLVIPFSQENAPKIFGGPIKTHFLMFLDEDADASDDILAGLKTVAGNNKGKMLAVTVGLDADRVMGYFGITEDDLPTAVIVNMPDGGAMKKYKWTGEDFTADTMGAFAASYFSGDLKPFLKSDPVPESQDEPVYVLVGTEFEKVAMDESKDVLVEFYAPWCGHCKNLAPIYDSLATRFEDVDSVVIAKMDATANEIDHPDVNVRGFPTLKFFPAGKDAGVIDYDGAREEDDFVEFLRANAAIPFTLDGEDGGGADHSEL